MSDFNEDFPLLKDEQLRTVTAIAAAAALVHSVAIRLGAVKVGAARIMGHILIPALPSLVDAKTVSVQFEDSADGVTFASVAGVPAFVSTGAGGIGAAAQTFDFAIPPITRKYVRVTETTLAAAGNNTALNVEFWLTTRIPS